ncbi:hypothetical protein [Nocardioides convexus]|uniref:hypothetical protein n=1 Tax=Nocardioides convexus TaxID=2712224 RepID=UPI002418ACFF|nr:hypothetical protein [Nocardioides convexus]
MTDTTRVAVLVGSLRADSLNRKLAEILRDEAPAGVESRPHLGPGADPLLQRGPRRRQRARGRRRSA